MMTFEQGEKLMREMKTTPDELDMMWNICARSGHSLIAQLNKRGINWRDMNISCIKTLPAEYSKIIGKKDVVERMSSILSKLKDPESKELILEGDRVCIDFNTDDTVCMKYKMYCRIEEVKETLLGSVMVVVKPIYMYEGNIKNFHTSGKPDCVELYIGEISEAYEYLTPTSYWDKILQEEE